ncbi:MAG: hypothetical protein U0V48_17195 [Anaerolineales bacterium]
MSVNYVYDYRRITLVISVGLFALDNAAGGTRRGLGTWISTVLGLLLGASAGIKGWLDWNKKESASQVMNITAKDGGQVSTGNEARNIQTENIMNISTKLQNLHLRFRLSTNFPHAPADFTGRG